MADLVAWLTQILDEDVERNRAHAETIAGVRTLADIAAKRAIIALHETAWNASVCTVCHFTEDGGETVQQEAYPCPTLRLEASAYADRPGYLDEWKP